MTLIVKGTWTQLPEPPRVWYPNGAHGAWLNYVAWCSQFNTAIPGSLERFDHTYLEPRINSTPALHFYQENRTQYPGIIQQRKDAPAWDDCSILFGSNRAWFNFFLNLQMSSETSADQDQAYQVAARYAGWYRRNITFNLEWCLIWTDPEQFLSDLGRLIKMDLPWNTGAQQAFEQYRAVCVFDPGQSDLSTYQRAVYDMATDQEITNEQARLQRAREIVYTTWYRI